ncbi:hypothetical protein AcV5_003141 [Taiwanofungus camphoratus]|nr:hypothetical protein AcV5_003141 [Antrodia cinnamomea]
MYPPGARHTAACVRHTTSTFKNARHRAPIHLIALAPNATLHLPSAHTHTSQALAPFRVRKGREKAVLAHASDVTGPDPTDRRQHRNAKGSSGQPPPVWRR